MTDTIKPTDKQVALWLDEAIDRYMTQDAHFMYVAHAAFDAGVKAALAAPQPEPLSMSMFANRADYEEALKAQPQPICPACHGPGLLYECVWCSAKNYPPEPQPFKQESWITAARLVVEATPEQLPMAIDAMRDLVEGAKP